GQEDVERPLRRERLMEAVWPEMAYGESGEPAPSLIPYQILSWQPRALYFPQFATAEQCENVVKTAKAWLRPSTLALRKGESEETTKGIRTSSGTFLSAEEDPTGALAEIETKIAKATMMPRSHGEPFNVLRYEIGQKYASHYDAFDPAQYGPQKSQRVSSSFTCTLPKLELYVEFFLQLEIKKIHQAYSCILHMYIFFIQPYI
uniref:Prolyl 4-hydroxylase alpha subunit domain-containing protein n=1 Tax=Aegilops tauschii subsp. strangulata TaxID=200361 RepID=A0A453LW10_AEGTS